MSRTYRRIPHWYTARPRIQRIDLYLYDLAPTYEHARWWERHRTQGNAKRVGKMPTPQSLYWREVDSFDRHHSNRSFKHFAHRKFRQRTKQALHRSQYDNVPLLLREVSDRWDVE